MSSTEIKLLEYKPAAMVIYIPSDRIIWEFWERKEDGIYCHISVNKGKTFVTVKSPYKKIPFVFLTRTENKL